MKKRLNKILIVWGFLIFISALLGRASIASDNGRTSGDFLNIGIGARAAALGGAYTSVSDDATAAYWNPAGLIGVSAPQITFSHFSWYQDISFDYLGASFPVSNKFNLSMGAQYLDYGRIEGYDVNDNPTGELEGTYDMAAGVTVGYKLNENFSLGLGAKYIIIALAGTKGTALAGDFGLKYSRGNVILGMALTNLGQKIKFEQGENKLPANFRAGLAVLPFGSSFLASFEAQKPLYGDVIFHNGYEYRFENRYFIRGGFSFYPQQNDRQFGQGISLGAGAILGPTQFDYSFSPKDSFSSDTIHRFSITLNFRK